MTGVVYNAIRYPGIYTEGLFDVPEVESFVADAVWFKFSQDPAPEKWCTGTLYRLTYDLSEFGPEYTGTATMNFLYPEYYSSSAESAQAYAEFIADVSDRHLCLEQYAVIPAGSEASPPFPEVSEDYASPGITYPPELFDCVRKRGANNSTQASAPASAKRGVAALSSVQIEGGGVNQAGIDCQSALDEDAGICKRLSRWQLGV